jgi:CopG family transcriptional regulator/antitoxin EndoAI
MKSVTVNISFNDELLKRIDQLARQESRSRSELLREAARAYIERQKRWNQIFESAEKQAKRASLGRRHARDARGTLDARALRLPGPSAPGIMTRRGGLQAGTPA